MLVAGPKKKDFLTDKNLMIVLSPFGVRAFNWGIDWIRLID